MAAKPDTEEIAVKFDNLESAANSKQAEPREPALESKAIAATDQNDAERQQAMEQRGEDPNQPNQADASDRIGRRQKLKRLLDGISTVTKKVAEVGVITIVKEGIKTLLERV